MAGRRDARLEEWVGTRSERHSNIDRRRIAPGSSVLAVRAIGPIGAVAAGRGLIGIHGTCTSAGAVGSVAAVDATGATGNYIVWAEDGQANSVWADGRMKEQTITGTIDYYTKTEYDVNFSTIQAALGVIGISYRLNSIQYEELTKYIHTEWVFEIG